MVLLPALPPRGSTSGGHSRLGADICQKALEFAAHLSAIVPYERPNGDERGSHFQGRGSHFQGVRPRPPPPTFGLFWYQSVEVEIPTLQLLATLAMDATGPLGDTTMNRSLLQVLAACLRLLRVHMVAARSFGLDLRIATGGCVALKATLEKLRGRLVELLGRRGPRDNETLSRLDQVVRGEALYVLLAGSRLFWSSRHEQLQLVLTDLAISRLEADTPPSGSGRHASVPAACLGALQQGLLRLLASTPLVSSLVLPFTPERGWNGVDEPAAAGTASAQASFELMHAWNAAKDHSGTDPIQQALLKVAAQLSDSSPRAGSQLLTQMRQASISHARLALAHQATASSGRHRGEAPVVLVGMLQEIAARAATEEPPLAVLRESVLDLLQGATAAFQQGAEAARLDEQLLQRSCLGELLLYLLDLLHQMTHNISQLAKDLLPSLHDLASAIGSLRLDGQAAVPASLHPATAEESLSTGRSARLELVESDHPLPPQPNVIRRTISLPGASHLSISFDGRCATPDFDLLTIELPAPPLPLGWTLETELESYRGPSPSEELERQARRAEYQGDASASHGLYLALYSGGGNPEHLLCAARVRLQLMHDPHAAHAMLTRLLEREGAIVRPSDEVEEAARLLLNEAALAAEAGAGRKVTFGGSSDQWPRRQLILPGDTCTLIFAPSGLAAAEESARHSPFSDEIALEPVVVGQASQKDPGDDDEPMPLVQARSTRSPRASSRPPPGLTPPSPRPTSNVPHLTHLPPRRRPTCPATTSQRRTCCSCRRRAQRRRARRPMWCTACTPRACRTRGGVSSTRCPRSSRWRSRWRSARPTKRGGSASRCGRGRQLRRVTRLCSVSGAASGG